MESVFLFAVHPCFPGSGAVDMHDHLLLQVNIVCYQQEPIEPCPFPGLPAWKDCDHSALSVKLPSNLSMVNEGYSKMSLLSVEVFETPMVGERFELHLVWSRRPMLIELRRLP